MSQTPSFLTEKTLHHSKVKCSGLARSTQESMAKQELQFAALEFPIKV